MSGIIRPGKLTVKSKNLGQDEWHVRELKNSYTIPQNSPEWIKQEYEKIVTINGLYHSSLSNVYKMRRYKNYTYVDMVNSICTALRVETENNIYCNYCLLYSSTKENILKIFSDIIDEEKVNIVEPQFYCASPSLISQDGEYRSRISGFSKLETVIKKNRDVFNYIENYLLEKIKDENLILSYEHFHPQLDLEKYVEYVDTMIINRRILICTFMQFWIIELYNVSTGLQENHINPKYNAIIFRNIQKDLDFLKSLYKIFGKSKVENILNPLIFSISQFEENAPYISFPTQIGQKLLPLNVSEVQSPLNITQKSWRELYVSQKLTDMVINFVCPSFPIYIDWYYIKNSKKGLFDNDQQYKKIELSERALLIMHKLRETQRLTYNNENIHGKMVRLFLSDILQEINDKIEDPVNIVKSKLLMSNVTMGILMENVGRTFYDIPVLEKHSKEWLNSVGSILKSEKLFKKHIFDICYALLCINSKLGIIHGDVHLNNITISPNIVYNVPQNPHVLYCIKNHWYLMETNGFYSYIVDFGRASINPKNLTGVLSPFDLNRFSSSQNCKIIDKLSNEFPSFYKTNLQNIMNSINNNFEKTYKLFSAIDVYSFSEKMLRHYKDIHPENTKLLTRLKKLSEYYLVNIMTKLFQNPNIDIEWPIYDIIMECFSENIVSAETPPGNIEIMDIWDIDREIKYSVDSYKNFPPYLKAAHILKNNGKFEVDKQSLLVEKSRTAYEKYRDESMKMVEYIAKRHLEKYK